MQSLKLVVALFVLVGFAASPVRAQIVLGAAGAEGEPFRRQEWRVPSSDTITPAHAVLFRPPGDGPFRLALIAHASTQNVLRRAQMPQPEYRALAAFLVARGFAVLMPERLGHGATGGRYVEDQGGCDEADYARSGRATAQEISRALECGRNLSARTAPSCSATPPAAGARLRSQMLTPRRSQKAISAVIAFAPGRGGHANDFPNRICAPHTLIAAAAEFGKAVRIPSHGWWRPMIHILRRHFRGNWRMRFATVVARSISARCRRWAARATG